MNWDYSRHYERFHPDTPEHDHALQWLLGRWLDPHLPAQRNAPVLDVGCGRGYALEMLRARGFSAIEGIDRDPGQVNFARGRGLPVSLVSDSAAYLRERPGTFRLMLLMDVLEHLGADSRSELLDAMHAAGASGCRLCCTVPNAASPMASYWRHIDYTHQTLFTVESLEYLLTSCGWRVRSIEPIEFHYRPRWLFWLPTRRTLRWTLRCLSRGSTRLHALGELGWTAGWKVPLAPNLLAVVEKP